MGFPGVDFFSIDEMLSEDVPREGKRLNQWRLEDPAGLEALVRLLALQAAAYVDEPVRWRAASTNGRLGVRDKVGLLIQRRTRARWVGQVAARRFATQAEDGATDPRVEGDDGELRAGRVAIARLARRGRDC